MKKIFSKKYFYLVLAPVLIGLSLLSYRGEQLTTNQVPSSATPKIAPAASNPSAPSSIAAARGDVGLIANLDPFASLALNTKFPLRGATDGTIAKLRTIQAMPSVADAELAAAMSDDPAIWVNSLHMAFPCATEPVLIRMKGARGVLDWISVDGKTGKPVPYSEQHVAFTELRGRLGPSRIVIPESVATSERARQGNVSLSGGQWPLHGNRVSAEVMDSWLEMRAPQTAAESEAFATMRESLAARCNGELGMSAKFGQAYRAQRDRFAAEGALGALLFNTSAGWTSGSSLRFLSERDYALVVQAFAEQSPDALATMLRRHRLLSDLDVAGIPPEYEFAQLVLGLEVGHLAACVLGVADCSPSGDIFQNACLLYGGCSQPDVAALWRYVLVRDGLPADAMDRVVADLVSKIRARNLEALGIRKKP